ncbi:MAG: hypothetical protein MJZ64_03800 [Paludibacteraceae bacterium]|nr:hypothetical protein [Paludibacteraceae bacterium]
MNLLLALIIISYNVENFFNNRYDTTRKTEQIARVVCNIGEWEKPAVVGLCEVENDSCLMRLCQTMSYYPYRFIHYDSPDERGIDVALLYDSLQFRPVQSQPLAVDLGGDQTRDILFVTGLIRRTDTLHLFMCHLPSMLGGPAHSEWKRQRAKNILQHHIDSLLNACSKARIIVMGDMNCSPKDDLNGLHNRMVTEEQKGNGTHCYQGQWSCLDQFYLSPALDTIARTYIYKAPWLLKEDEKKMDSIPRRTNYEYHYDRDGFSDHLPIVLNIP